MFLFKSCEIKIVFHIIFTEEWLSLQRNSILTPWPQQLCIKNNGTPLMTCTKLFDPPFCAFMKNNGPPHVCTSPPPFLIYDWSLIKMQTLIVPLNESDEKISGHILHSAWHKKDIRKQRSCWHRFNFWNCICLCTIRKHVRCELTPGSQRAS